MNPAEFVKSCRGQRPGQPRDDACKNCCFKLPGVEKRLWTLASESEECFANLPPKSELLCWVASPRRYLHFAGKNRLRASRNMLLPVLQFCLSVRMLARGRTLMLDICRMVYSAYRLLSQICKTLQKTPLRKAAVGQDSSSHSGYADIDRFLSSLIFARAHSSTTIF
jgi:hypothetical protein